MPKLTKFKVGVSYLVFVNSWTYSFVKFVNLFAFIKGTINNPKTGVNEYIVLTTCIYIVHVSQKPFSPESAIKKTIFF